MKCLLNLIQRLLLQSALPIKLPELQWFFIHYNLIIIIIIVFADKWLSSQQVPHQLQLHHVYCALCDFSSP